MTEINDFEAKLIVEALDSYIAVNRVPDEWRIANPSVDNVRLDELIVEWQPSEQPLHVQYAIKIQSMISAWLQDANDDDTLTIDLDELLMVIRYALENRMLSLRHSKEFADRIGLTFFDEGEIAHLQKLISRVTHD